MNPNNQTSWRPRLFVALVLGGIMFLSLSAARKPAAAPILAQSAYPTPYDYYARQPTSDQQELVDYLYLIPVVVCRDECLCDLCDLQFQDCFKGPDMRCWKSLRDLVFVCPFPPDCLAWADLDRDGDVDMADWGLRTALCPASVSSPY